MVRMPQGKGGAVYEDAGYDWANGAMASIGIMVKTLATSVGWELELELAMDNGEDKDGGAGDGDTGWACVGDCKGRWVWRW